MNILNENADQLVMREKILDKEQIAKWSEFIKSYTVAIHRVTYRKDGRMFVMQEIDDLKNSEKLLDEFEKKIVTQTKKYGLKIEVIDTFVGISDVSIPKTKQQYLQVIIKIK